MSALAGIWCLWWSSAEVYKILKTVMSLNDGGLNEENTHKAETVLVKEVLHEIDLAVRVKVECLNEDDAEINGKGLCEEDNYIEVESVKDDDTKRIKDREIRNFPKEMVVKPEPESDSAVSDAAARAGLCEEHQVKDELVVGPEGLQPRDSAYATDSEIDADSVPGNSARAQPPAAPGAGEGAFTCEICHKQFSKKQNLAKHIYTHTGERPFSCEICHKKFTQTSHLNVHMRIHTGEKPFTCEVCHKQFANTGQLNDHKRVHTGEKPFSCNVCQKQFAYTSSLNAHKRLHTRENTFSCETCNEQFAHLSSLNKHKRRVHTKETFSCEVCHKKFSYKCHLRAHKLVHTGEKPYSCAICDKQFSHSSHLSSHKRLHMGVKPFSCDTCHKRFSRTSHLNAHKRIHAREK